MSKIRGVPNIAWGMIALVGVAIVLALALLGSSSSSKSSYSFTGSGYPNGDAANTRFETGPINSSSITGLKVGWTLPINPAGSYGGFASSPIISKGVVYGQDLSSNVEAVELETGKVLWTKTYNEPDHGPNGVVVANHQVYGATTTDAFALDEKTGKQIWSVPLVRNKHETIDMAPGYQDGTVYVSTVPYINANEEYSGGGSGVLWALKAKTGKKLWHFNTVPLGLWGNPKINSGGGLWYTPAFDGRGSMYVGVGNPGPTRGTEKFPWGSSRPGPNLYTNSIVKLNAKTGKLKWYYQLTPHDVNDWDLQDSPILVKSKGKEIVIGAGKSGIVIALDAGNGRLVWKRPVGLHNGHDDIGLEAMKGEYPDLKKPLLIYPGAIGGVIAPMSTNGSTVFVPVVNDPLAVAGPTEQGEPGPSSGEMVALDVATGKVMWKQKFTTPAFGAALTVNDLVFATTYNGNVSALDAKTGSVVWRETLPAGVNSGVVAEGNMLIAPAGLAVGEGRKPQIVAYELGE